MIFVTDNEFNPLAESLTDEHGWTIPEATFPENHWEKTLKNFGIVFYRKGY